jgi:hypothetical protein
MLGLEKDNGHNQKTNPLAKQDFFQTFNESWGSQLDNFYFEKQSPHQLVTQTRHSRHVNFT